MGAVHPASILPLSTPLCQTCRTYSYPFKHATTLLSLFKIPKVHRTIINLLPRANLTNFRCAVLI